MSQHLEISVKGRIRQAPALHIDGRTLVVKGRWIKKAVVYDQLYVTNGLISDPGPIIAGLKHWSERPDIFEFAQETTVSSPQFTLPFEWDNMAILPITDYGTWLATQAKKDVKENLRRSRREGVIVRSCPYDDQLIQGIKGLYDETPLRQGRPFWHYGKSIEQIRSESGHYADRSEFIGAFVGNELVGFLKMVYVGDIAKTMYVIAKESHFHRRPVNAMLAKAIEICATKGIRYFNYGVYDYPGKKNSSLTDFKSRHGFVRFDYPRYYVPLTWRGRLFIMLGLHLGYKHLIPMWLTSHLLNVRSRVQHRIVLPVREALNRNRPRRGGHQAANNKPGVA